MKTSYQWSAISEQPRASCGDGTVLAAAPKIFNAQTPGGQDAKEEDKVRGQSFSPVPLGALAAWRLGGKEFPSQTTIPPRRTRAFTLIEIMVVIGIMAIIFAIAMPSVYRQMHKDSMRQAVTDVLEACSRARERAILTGQTCEVHLRPVDRMISVTGSSAPAPSAGANRSYSFEGEAGNEQVVEHKAGTGELFSAKISDRITFTYIEVNQMTDLEQSEDVMFAFFANGTADEAGLVLRSDNNEARSILVDVITGIASVQESKQGGKL